MKMYQAMAAVTLLVMASSSFADVRAGSNGKCPSGYSGYTRGNGDRMCKSPDKSSSSSKSKRSSKSGKKH